MSPLSGEPTEKLLERLCEEQGLLAPASDRDGALQLDAETTAELLRRPDAAFAIAAALPKEARGREPDELHRHRVLCKIAEELLSSMEPRRALPVLLERLKSADPDVAEASGNALLTMATREPAIYEHLLDPLAPQRSRRLALRALIDRKALGDLEARVLRLVPARVDPDLVLLALSFGSRRAVLAIADVILRGDPSDGVIAVYILEDLQQRDADHGLLLPMLLRAVRERDDTQLSFPLLDMIHRALIDLIDLDSAFALGDSERLFESPGDLRAALERWLDDHIRDRYPEAEPPQIEGIVPFGARAWEARIRQPGGEIGLYPAHCGTGLAPRDPPAGLDGPRRLERAYAQSFVAAGLPLYTYGTYLRGLGPHELSSGALLRSQLDLLETDDSAIEAPASPISAHWIASHAQSLGRLRAGRYLIAEVELPLTRLEAGAPPPLALEKTVRTAVGSEPRADADADADADESADIASSFPAPYAVSLRFGGSGEGEWSAEIAFLPAREPPEEDLREGERFSIAYAWFRPRLQLFEHYGAPFKPGLIQLYAVILHGEQALMEAARRGTAARIVLWDPLESTCRHASLSIL